MVDQDRLNKTIQSPDRLAVTAKDAARLVGVSRATWFKYRAADLVPAPIRIGGCIRWLVDGPTGLRAWLDAGAPPRERWEAMQRRGQA